ncbi:hypothetical protein SISSUDRAFT_1062661 [Sistotremastrum suecicum HHB10207 ss-3]|uniref:Glycoside hydrolase family 125 protein n=1 Tax=Sistotremastrum suecicum HHB10207 ss-3 TaxID=1314776 RepID=A0A166CNC7_9AGAM|nr:hypothetical protein SISSUDRAFT_1062661 [Sistotremastrum suecicum HHB10207 ss-3]
MLNSLTDLLDFSRSFSRIVPFINLASIYQTSSSQSAFNVAPDSEAPGCPSYTLYSQSPQGNASSGPLGLPFMRPPPECRTFTSSAVEKVVDDMNKLIANPDLARLFENTFPSTLDTTIKYFNQTENVAFIITGDISAQWLRDTTNQLAHYRALLPLDPNLQALVKAIINTEARWIAEYPYCGAFQPPPESGLSPTFNPWAAGVTVNPPVNNLTVFECKYELDSLSGFLKLSRIYWQYTNDLTFANDKWTAAISQMFRVIEEQSQATFDEEFNFISYYNWTGGADSLSPPVNNYGNAEPKAYTGMVGTHHRPSDDLSTFAFLTPANAMLSTELMHQVEILDLIGDSNTSALAREWSARIESAIWDTSIVDGIFAYESNGFGGQYVMDDANVPSLLSLPYLGFLDRSDATYRKTKDILMSRKNPYYAAGAGFVGVGGPHADAWHPWPMSLISAIYGTDDDDEIREMLYMIVNNTSGLGLIHESVSIYNSSSYTRPWFAWANSYFAEMVLDLAERKPHLILKMEQPYRIGMN